MELFTAKLDEISVRIQSLSRYIKSTRRHAYNSTPDWAALLATLQELRLLVGRLESAFYPSPGEGREGKQPRKSIVHTASLRAMHTLPSGIPASPLASSTPARDSVGSESSSSPTISSASSISTNTSSAELVPSRFVSRPIDSPVPAATFRFVSDRGSSVPNPPDSMLHLSDLGDSLLNTLGSIISQNKHTAKVSLDDIDFNNMALGKNVIPLAKDQQFAVRYQNSDHPSCSQLHLDPCNKLRLPVLKRDACIPPDERFDSWFRTLLSNPPTKRVAYYVGPLEGTFAEHLQDLFPSGNRVSELITESSSTEGHFPGVSSLYGHIGEAMSGTAFHCEDANLRSYNLTLIGWKTWILIEPSHTLAFEQLIRRLHPHPSQCDQFVRHSALLIHPDKLRSEKIAFSVVHSGPGDLVLTRPRQYHAVINRTASFAIATNFALGDEDPIPERLLVCTEDAFFHVKDHRIRRLGSRNALEEQNKATIVSVKRHTHTIPEKRLFKDISAESSDIFPVIATLTSWMQTTGPILRLVSLVRIWRCNDSLRKSLLQIQSQHGNELLEALSGLSSQTSRYSHFHSFLETLVNIRFVRSLQSPGKKRIPRKSVERVLRARKLDLTPETRKSFQNELSHYRSWADFCGEAPDYTYDGILCLLPLGFSDQVEVRRNDIRDLTKAAYQSFHLNLNTLPYFSGLCQIGQRFQNAIFGLTDLKEQPFEQVQEADLMRLPLEDLLALLRLPQN